MRVLQQSAMLQKFLGNALCATMPEVLFALGQFASVAFLISSIACPMRATGPLVLQTVKGVS